MKQTTLLLHKLVGETTQLVQCLPNLSPALRHHRESWHSCAGLESSFSGEQGRHLKVTIHPVYTDSGLCESLWTIPSVHLWPPHTYPHT